MRAWNRAGACLVVWWFVSRERPEWRRPFVAILIAILPSISLVWQHRPIDILLGTIAAAIGIALGEWFYRKETVPLRTMHPSFLVS
ncbi:MAG: hypothetical protein ABIQ35_05145 [Verrucomicrobiota bacterium]